MNALHNNGENVCPVYDFQPNHENQVPFCTFTVRKPIDPEIISSKELEIQFDDTRDPAGIIIDPAFTESVGIITKFKAVLK
jgi:hypothetical protein